MKLLFQLTVRILLLAIILLTVNSCRTPKERAERLILKANKLYPIEKLESHKVVIDTILFYDTVVVAQGDSIHLSLPVIKKDTVIEYGKETYVYSPVLYKNKLVFENDKAKIIANTNKNGNIDYNVVIKDQKIRVKGSVKLKKQITTYRKVYTVTVYVKGWIWWVGLISTIGIGIGIIIISIRTLKRFKII